MIDEVKREIARHQTEVAALREQVAEVRRVVQNIKRRTVAPLRLRQPVFSGRRRADSLEQERKFV